MRLLRAKGQDRAEMESLLDCAFGVDRQKRAAYLLRQGNAPLEDLDLIVRDAADRLIGMAQFWPFSLVAGHVHDILLVGPVAVLPEMQGQGVGHYIMSQSLARADRAGHLAFMMIGDQDYYGLWGFKADPGRDWRFPVAVERHRFLVRILPGLSLPNQGFIRSPRERKSTVM